MEIFSFESIMYVFFYFAVSRYGPRCEEKAGGVGDGKEARATQLP